MLDLLRPLSFKPIVLPIQIPLLGLSWPSTGPAGFAWDSSNFYYSNSYVPGNPSSPTNQDSQSPKALMGSSPTQLSNYIPFHFSLNSQGLSHTDFMLSTKQQTELFLPSASALLFPVWLLLPDLHMLALPQPSGHVPKVILHGSPALSFYQTSWFYYPGNCFMQFPY